MTRDGRKKFQKQLKQQQQQQQQKQQKQNQNKEKRSRSSDHEEEVDNDNSGFTVPKKFARNQKEVPVKSADTENQFDALEGEVDLNNVDMAPLTQERRPPPIILEKPEDTRAFTKEMAATFSGSINFRATRNTLTIMTKDADTYRKVKALLNDTGKRYYTFTEHEDKSKSLVIKGIDRETTKEDIKEDLISQGLRIIDVYPMTRKIRDKTDKTKATKSVHMDMFQIKFPKDTNIQDVRKVQYVCHFKITWEKLIKKDIGTQCRNCQRFGHAASNCRMGYRCVKCKEQGHEPGQCKKESPDTPAFCVNCGGSHPANYRNCTTYKSYVSRLAPKKPTIPPGFRKVSPVVRPPTYYVRPGVSYAAAATTSPVARPQPTVRPQHTEVPLPQQAPSQGHEDVIGGMFYWFDEMKALFKCTLVELTNKLQVLRPILESVSSKKDRFTIYMDFLLQCRD